ncbi:DUF4160 domain-containing protein [Kangiella sediminilitoris]|uniref:DUF4160 domain-containing protein n=1 Tax=Kangiella sediminilitoris TaxID=1144748 RepID=A0A1B3B7J7_9GAMM|nr:DUF4160 domain-containing protein [Kangiella sediminilitoris]AOE48765.1 hypothetical protein KS2013_33 [Kangiella sediminilitoris]
MKLSEMPIEKLKETPWFHNVDPDKLRSFEDHAAWLEAILHNPCNVWEEDGEMFLIEIKQLVTRVNGLKIEVYSNEHPPPHFHVKSPNVDASFDIESCTFLQGQVDSRDKKKIEFWHRKAKPLLVEAWNSTRPTDCTVGLYKGT